ncbi:hypothetical protein WDZ17_02745 [Pseudokineococcus basanitobsidens]|uniref:Uncharacterized protein n=1 Tax=Pseudokineococcus basanitobsidens TaxID=1926649 RepID=A0ABU8RGN9_9ACTN
MDEQQHPVDESARQTSQPDRRVRPPTWPAARLTTNVQLLVGDDVGTDQRFASGEEGGDDSPWGVLRRYPPAPPSSATALRLRLVVAGRPDVEVTVPLTA